MPRDVHRTHRHPPLVAFVAGGVAVWLVLTFVGRLGNDVSSRRSASAAIADLPPGRSTAPSSRRPILPPRRTGARTRGSLGAWHRRRFPAAPTGLLAAAGIPVQIVHDATSAFRHPLVLSWPTTDLSAGERAAFAAYSRRGGTLLAIAPDGPTRRARASGDAAP